MQKNKGITLIALVITIIVLLILAGVSINLIIGNNGVIAKSKDSKRKAIIGQEKEQIELARVSIFASKKGDSSITAEELQTELIKLVGENKTDTIDHGNKVLTVEFIDTNHYYSIENGLVQEYAEIDVSELGKKLEEYKDVIGKTNKYTESTYNDFYLQYEIAEKIIEEGKGTENVIKSVILQLEEKYNLLKDRHVPVMKKCELTTDGTTIYAKNYTGDNFGDYYKVLEHRICVL